MKRLAILAALLLAAVSCGVRKAREYADTHADTQPRFVMINAWNEWIEGSYLLPDEVYGYGWLEAVRNVFKDKH